MPVAFFAFASLLPSVLLIAGALWGGLWIWAAMLSIMLFWLAMDRLSGLVPEDRSGAEGVEFPAGTWLLVMLAVMQLIHIPVAIWALTGRLHGVEWIVGFSAFGVFFGQIGNPAAHELIHRSDRRLRQLGMTVYTSVLFGHHASAHMLVHHIHVATPLDPNSARKGQGFWRFLPRAWIGSFRAGLEAERALSQRASGRRLNPYWLYCAGGALVLALCAVSFGPWGVLIYLGLCGHAQSQLLVSDYVQHYGLRRAKLANGRYEPVNARHSWNAFGWYSSAMMLNAPRHSDHHARPARTFANLTIPQDAPILPAPLPAMAMLALVPPLWRKMMDPRLEALETSTRL